MDEVCLTAIYAVAGKTFVRPLSITAHPAHTVLGGLKPVVIWRHAGYTLKILPAHYKADTQRQNNSTHVYTYG